jgi:hypothetical protein
MGGAIDQAVMTLKTYEGIAETLDQMQVVVYHVGAVFEHLFRLDWRKR